ncbi:hypothetical protein ACIA98_36730 [Streptomyces sp. NPDC051366]|uniref:hypothetical protein n=1 Tax=Streptomyces sp. NPDC051366 TaxID=3365652 RepID=UPI003789D605
MAKRGWERPSRVRRGIRWPVGMMHEVADLAKKDGTTFTSFVSQAVDSADVAGLGVALRSARAELDSSEPMAVRTLYWEDRFEQQLVELRRQPAVAAEGVSVDQLLLACVKRRIAPNRLSAAS